MGKAAWLRWRLASANADCDLRRQEAKNSAVAEEASVIKLYCQMPPIAKLDNSLNTLKNCE